jgi:hypothetical protein
MFEAQLQQEQQEEARGRRHRSSGHRHVDSDGDSRSLHIAPFNPFATTHSSSFPVASASTTVDIITVTGTAAVGISAAESVTAGTNAQRLTSPFRHPTFRSIFHTLLCSHMPVFTSCRAELAASAATTAIETGMTTGGTGRRGVAEAAAGMAMRWSGGAKATGNRGEKERRATMVSDAGSAAAAEREATTGADGDCSKVRA